MAIVLGVSFFYLNRIRSFCRQTFIISSTAFTFVIIGFGYFLVELRFRTVQQRIEQNLTAIELTLTHPFSGVGWQLIYPRYLDHVIHNTVLNYFASGGIVVGILFLLIIVYPLFIGLRGLIFKSNDQLYILTFLSMLVVIIIELMLYKSTPNIYLFVISGMICVAVNRQQ
jgi:hypothetical protein